MSNSSKRKSYKQLTGKISKTIVVALLVISAYLYFQFALGAASIGIWIQAIPVLIAALSIVAGTYRFTRNKSALPILFWGTLPAWIFHIPATIFYEDESPIFVIATGVMPIIASVIWIAKRWKH